MRSVGAWSLASLLREVRQARQCAVNKIFLSCYQVILWEPFRVASAQEIKDTERTARVEATIAARAMQPGMMETVGKFVAGVQLLEEPQRGVKTF